MIYFFNDGKEGFCKVFLVLLRHSWFRKNLKAGSNKFQSFCFEPGNNLPDKTALDAVGFDHDE